MSTPLLVVITKLPYAFLGFIGLFVGVTLGFVYNENLSIEDSHETEINNR
jgi:hypothetical protein